ncbi:hypothetical protein DMN91_011579, partial [Ooceraea biroi]
MEFLTCSYETRYERRGPKRAESQPESEQSKLVRRCFSCGTRNHVGADCPMKNEGVKYFRCGEKGHVAARCSKQGIGKKNSCVAFAKRGCMKEVAIGGVKMHALLDTGSDISLLSEAQYRKLNLPPLTRESVVFRGIGADNNRTMGLVNTEIEIDEHVYAICMHVIS